MHRIASSGAVALAGILGVGVLAGCSSARQDLAPYQSEVSALPADLPSDPDPCTRYCKVWVPPVYRDAPKIETRSEVVETPAYYERVRYREVCVKPRTHKMHTVPGCQRCDEVPVQTRAGGYRWIQDGECWKYCYVPPCYKWCTKHVQEDSISYCTESPPEYRIEACIERVPTTRRELRSESRVRWCRELYDPGHHEWHAQKTCCGCVCPQPCPVDCCPPVPPEQACDRCN